MKPYSLLSTQGQVDRIRKAIAGLPEAEWGLKTPRLRLVSHQYNTTFRVDSAGGRFALRVNVGSTHGKEKILAEIDFVNHLQQAKSFKVAAPVPKTDGTFVATVPIEGVDRPIHAVLYEWLPDPTVKDRATPRIMSLLGSATRELHELGATYRPAGPTFPILSDPYYGDPYRLADQELDLGVFQECEARTREVFENLKSRPRIPLHADLHLNNVKFGKHGLAIFDFDDAQTSWPIMDAAISLWYFRWRTVQPSMEASYWQGFGFRPEDLGVSPEEFETLVAARTLLLVNHVVATDNALAREYAVPFVKKCEASLRMYLATGAFTPYDLPRNA